MVGRATGSVAPSAGGIGACFTLPRAQFASPAGGVIDCGTPPSESGNRTGYSGARKRWRRAGSTDDREPWKKPKWMRWNTFSRLVLEGREAQEQGDWLFLKGFSAGLARIIDKRRRG
jgi:hypothetical protein